MLETLTQLVLAQWAALDDPREWWAVAAGAVGGVLIIISAFVRTMVPLRSLAVGSNIGFVFYGVLHPSPMVAVLHIVLLPVNIWRVTDMIRLTRRARATAGDGGQLQVWLKPYMRVRRRRPGAVIFRSGDIADRLYYLVEGTVDLPELGRTLEAGQMFGEIAFFAPDRRRSSGAVCRTGCTLMSIDEDTFKQLCHQDPDFGFHVVSLIAARLASDVTRLRQQRGGAAT